MSDSRDMLILNGEAEKFGVIPNVHANDFMFEFLKQMNGGSEQIAATQYFQGGHNDAAQLLRCMDDLPLLDGSKTLEFASGYGRITRHLRKQRPNLNLTSADIHEAAVTFIAREFGIKTHHSATDPKKLEIDDKFDFVFVLSLFSHLPEHRFSQWLESLFRLVRTGGYLLFTTHGEVAYNQVEFLRGEYDKEKGFGFQLSSEQLDLNAAEYGTTVSAPHFVISAIYESVGARIVSFKPGCWFGLQDQWILQK